MPEALKRNIGLGLLTAYGVGVMVGAGIYVLVGTVAAQAGVWAPLSFVLAGIIAAPTALSYAEFSARIPEAAGEAAYVDQGLRQHWLAVFVGLAIVVAGTVSAAAVLRGGSGYLTTILPIDSSTSIFLLGAFLVAVAIIGVLESLSLAAVFTVIELLGLVLVVWAGFSADPTPAMQAPAPPALAGIAAGAVLAFFAFIGFEDIVNMAEEVRDPTRTMPRAILMALAITSVIYALVCYAAVRAVPLGEIGVSEQPLALVWQAGTGRTPTYLAAIAVIAALNGVLAQIVMASRVMFGLGRREPRLSVFYHAHPRFRTPVLATVLIGAVVIVTAIILPVAQLAEATTLVLLTVFTIVNAALIVEKRRTPEAGFSVPMWVPWLGVIGSLAMAAAGVLVG